MIRIRASSIEKYRMMLTDDFVTEEEVLDYCRAGQEGEPNKRMLVGTAWHKCVEQPHETYFEELNAKNETIGLHAAEGFVFRTEAVRAMREYQGPGLREVEKVIPLKLPSGEIELKGTIDHKWGLRIRDMKTKIKVDTKPQIDAADYEHSLQWRIYLMLINGHEFIYDCVPGELQDDGALVEIGAPVSFSFFRYPGMEADVMRWCESFLDWAIRRNVVQFLEYKGS